MTNLKKETYQTFQNLILRSEGKTLEDELGFGCRMSNLYQEEGNIYKIKKFICKKLKHYQCFEHDGTLSLFPKDALEILGQDITLERVLRVFKDQYACDGDGTFFDSFGGEPITKWQLCKPAHEQSEETILKLIDLLK